jgi:hypothetical protein
VSIIVPTIGIPQHSPYWTSSHQLRSNPRNPRHTRRAHNLSKKYTEMSSPGIERGASVSGVVRRNQVPRLKVGTHSGHISYIYPRTARATGSRSTSTIGEIIRPRLPWSTTYGCVHYRAHHWDLTTRAVVRLRVVARKECPLAPRRVCNHAGVVVERPRWSNRAVRPPRESLVGRGR